MTDSRAQVSNSQSFCFAIVWSMWTKRRAGIMTANVKDTHLKPSRNGEHFSSPAYEFTFMSSTSFPPWVPESVHINLALEVFCLVIFLHQAKWHMVKECYESLNINVMYNIGTSETKVQIYFQLRVKVEPMVREHPGILGHILPSQPTYYPSPSLPCRLIFNHFHNLLNHDHLVFLPCPPYHLPTLGKADHLLLFISYSHFWAAKN